jgi:serine/threonine protein kinase
MQIRNLTVNPALSYSKEIEKLIINNQLPINKHNPNYLTGRKKNTLQILNIPGIAKPLVLKIFRTHSKSSILRRLDSIFSASYKNHAKISYQGSLMLSSADICTPAPVAYWNLASGPWDKTGYFLYEQKPAKYTLEQIRHMISSEPSKENLDYFDRLVSYMAVLTKKMHIAGIRHGDIVTHNFLVGDNDQLVLLDTDHVKRSRNIRILKPFFDLHCLRRLDFSPEGQYFFLGKYFGRTPRKFEWLAFKFWFLGGFRLRRWFKKRRPLKPDLVQPGQKNLTL